MCAASRRPSDLGSRSLPLSPAVSDDELRAILSVADCLIGRAGRTTLMLALRGSRAKRVTQFGTEKSPGHGFHAGRPEAEVMSRIDALIRQGVLKLEYNDGLPLLGYTPRGLDRAMRFAAEEWFSILRSRVQPVAAGAPLDLPFLMVAMPDRNHDTVFLVVEFAAHEADGTWLPLLRAWSATETKRVRARLAPIIAALESRPKAPVA